MCYWRGDALTWVMPRVPSFNCRYPRQSALELQRDHTVHSVDPNQRIYILTEQTAPPPLLNWDAFLCFVCCILLRYSLSVCITADRAGGERHLLLKTTGGAVRVRSLRIYILWSQWKDLIPVDLSSDLYNTFGCFRAGYPQHSFLPLNISVIVRIKE